MSHAWVEVEVQKGNLVSIYRGRIGSAQLEAWMRGDLQRGVVVLEDVYWSYDPGDGVEGWMVLGETPGPYAHAVGKTLIRADLILVMVPLRDGSEREAHKLRSHIVGGIADA